MKRSHKLVLLAVGAFLIAPVAGRAQGFTCPNGQQPVFFPGFGYFCPATPSAPEINASAGVGGLALLVSGMFMISGRRKKLSAN